MNKQEYIELLNQAQLREEEARDFYLAVSEKTNDVFLKKLFKDLSDEEQGHYNLFEKYKKDVDIEMNFALVEDYKISETVDTPKLTVDMQPADAIALAMKNEEAAVKFYTELSKKSTDPEKKKVFLDLAAMELGHKYKLEMAFVDIGYPELY